MGKTIALPGYSTASGAGAGKIWRGDFFGSNNYQQPGETLVPGTFGFGAIESVRFDGYSASNNYFARVQWPANSFSANEQAAPVFAQGPSSANNANAPQVRIFIAGNNAQAANATDLSAEVFRMTVEGV